MNMEKKGQVIQSAADVYESFFVPALFQAWPAQLATLAGVEAGWRVLDVACGTGVLARHAADLVGQGNLVSGVDINEGMLSVARAKNPTINWQQASAESLPFDNNLFDAVFCQFGLMFFDQPVQAVQEMYRVLLPGGRLTLAVWDALENSPGYSALVNLLERLFGTAIANELRAPYRLGKPGELTALLTATGITGFSVQSLPGTARFPSIDDWMLTEIKGWTLADVLDDDQFQHLLRQAREVMQPFTDSTGRVSFAAPALLAHIE